MIGENGTGKTQFLNKLVLGLGGETKESIKNFSPIRPKFSEIIIFSYSIFDSFTPPENIVKNLKFRNNVILVINILFMLVNLLVHIYL